MRKPMFCICQNKDPDKLPVTAKLISAFVFATRIVQSLFFLNPKFPVSSHLLWLCSSVCVGPGRKPERWFSHDTAQMFYKAYLRFNFRNLKCEINTSCGPGNRFSPSRNTPANTKSVSDIKLMIIIAEIIYTIQPAVVILPRLK